MAEVADRLGFETRLVDYLDTLAENAWESGDWKRAYELKVEAELARLRIKTLAPSTLGANGCSTATIGHRRHRSRPGRRTNA